jgi:hypothetical protein
MRYELRLTAFDMLDKVHISWSLRASEGGDPLQLPAAFEGVATLDGSGENDPLSWVRDALVGALETL